MATIQSVPLDKMIKYLNWFYIDTACDELPPRCFYKLYPQARRHQDAYGSYLVYLPFGYDEALRQYPVLYWLHGGLQTQRQGLRAIDFYAQAMDRGQMPHTIIVAPQILPVGWYVNAKDGSRPLADIVIHDLIPHVDSSYRTIQHRESRWLEGWSMGGYGALHIGLSNPETFGALSMIKGPLLRDLSLEPEERTVDTFFRDQAYFDECHPLTLLQKHVAALTKRSLRVRLLHGAADSDLGRVYTMLLHNMQRLGIKCMEITVDDAVPDDFGAMLNAVDKDATDHWRGAYEETHGGC